MGWHRDNEREIDPAIIASVSLGAQRDFKIRHRTTRETWTVPLGHGDLLSMAKIMMKSIYDKFNYISEPHGVIGYLGLKKYGLKTNEFGVFLETAHPVKFLEVVEETLKVDVEIPSQIKEVMSREKVATSIANYQELKLFLNR